MTHRTSPLLPAIVAVCLAFAASVGVVQSSLQAAGDPAAFTLSKVAVVTAKGRFDFNVEMARSPEQLQRGLMGRAYMAPSAGMLFDFGPSQPVTMWMKDTPLSLDMLFIDAAGIVVNIAEATTPFSLATIPSQGPVRAVMELNAGTARRIGAKPGDRVIHEMFSAP